METKLFDKLNGRMPVFNKPLLDMMAGDYYKGIPQLGLTQLAVLPHQTVLKSTYALRLMDTIKSIKPDTTERWHAATMFLSYLGYHVVWDDQAVCPSVHWVNTEGNADDEAAFIHDILHKDYTVE